MKFILKNINCKAQTHGDILVVAVVGDSFSEELEKLQRRANFPIMYLKLSYAEVLAEGTS